MSFTFFSSLIFLTFFVFIFYLALIMKTHFFLLIRTGAKNHLIKYLHNQNNHSFHHSILTCVLITCFFTKSVKLELRPCVHLMNWI